MRKLFAVLAIVLGVMAASSATGQAAPVPVPVPAPADAARGVVGNFYLENYFSYKCLDLENWGSGRYVQQYPCHYGDNQLWQFVEDPGWLGTYEIKPIQYTRNGLNECLDVENWGTGVYTQRYPCHLGNNQRWQIYDYNSGTLTFTVRPVSDLGKCLDASDWGRGVRVQIYPCHGGTNQLWRLFA
jgi:hypothetical protein